MKTDNLTKIEAVIFDFDGTLTKPEALDFNAIRKTVGCPEDIPVLEFISGISNPTSQKMALAELDRFETDGAAGSVPAGGSSEIIDFLQSRGIPATVLTRNSYRSVVRALQNFKNVQPGDFAEIVTRDDNLPVKPDPAGVHRIASRLNVLPENILMVGDYIFDIEAGRQAGCRTVLIDPTGRLSSVCTSQDFTVSTLSEVMEIIKMNTGLPAGKLPNDILGKLLEDFAFEDPAVLINPGIGEDTAAVDVQEKEVLVLKSDPITFATDAIGQYAVLVNANDIATSGATPRWMLTTLLFPVDTTAAQIATVVADLVAVCRRWGITLCGGHTEITDAVRRPVISGMLTGTVSKKGLIDKKNIRPGNHLLLTKSVCVEGTSILAREMPQKLEALGIPPDELQHAQEMLAHISILPEASVAAEHAGVSGMHDVTEGGLATAVGEIGAACGCVIHVEMDRIPVYDVTRRICRKLGLNPLGLIGSGSLLICCEPETSASLADKIRSAGIRVEKIGEVREAGTGVTARQNGRNVPWPDFEVDEIARLFASQKADECP